MALFQYTLIVLFFVMVVASTCISTFTVTHHRIYLWSAGLFTTYFFDVALVFRRIMVPPLTGTAVYVITSAPESILLGAGLLLFSWLVVLEFLHRRTPMMLIGITVFVVGSAVSLVIMPFGGIREFVFYSMRGVGAVTLIGYIVRNYVASQDPAERARMRVHRPIIVACAVCVILVVLENVLGQILTLIPASTGILPERNFCENILFVGMGAWALNRCVRTLRIRAQELPTISNPLAAEFVASSAQCFAQKHGLSAREVEVLLLVLRGEGNKEIADSLFLSVNTVKVHVHHILRKCGTGDRGQLIRSFWEAA